MWNDEDAKKSHGVARVGTNEYVAANGDGDGDGDGDGGGDGDSDVGNGGGGDGGGAGHLTNLDSGRW